MTSLPGWVDTELAARGIVAEEFKRGDARPPGYAKRWFFCGWYWHQATRGRVIEGPHGPFRSWSAALADAAHFLGAERLDAGQGVIQLPRNRGRHRTTTRRDAA